MPKHTRKVPMKYMRRFKGALFCDFMDGLIEDRVEVDADRRGIPLYEHMPNHYEQLPPPPEPAKKKSTKNDDKPILGIVRNAAGGFDRIENDDDDSFSELSDIVNQRDLFKKPRVPTPVASPS